MYKPRRQHPVAALTSVLKTFKEFLIPFVIIFVLGGQGAESITFYVSVAGGFLFLLFIWGVVSWLRYTYRIEDGELRIEYGVVVRNKIYIPQHRIQVIDITSGIIQRMFGLVSVQVQTAGGSAPEAVINAVNRDEADELRRLLRAETGRDAADEEPPTQRWILSRRDLMIAATTSGSFGVALSIIGTITSQMDHILSETQVYEFLESATNSGTNMIIIALVAMIMAAWLMALIGTLIKFSGFQLIKKSNELVITRGLFERKQLTIPFRRIQAVRIVEGILRQPFGLATVYVESAGYGDEGGKSTVVFPLLKRRNVETFIREMIPEYQFRAPSVNPPPRGLTRYLIRTFVPALMIVSAATLLFAYGYFSGILIPLALLLGFMRYRDAAIGHTRDALIMRYRRLARTTALIRKYRIQSSDLSANFFQRRKVLTTFSTTVASGDSGADFTIKELSTDWGNHFLSWTSSVNSIHQNDGPKGEWLPHFWENPMPPKQEESNDKDSHPSK